MFRVPKESFLLHFLFLFAYAVFSLQEKFKLLVHVFLMFNLMKPNHATSIRWNISASDIITDLISLLFLFSFECFTCGQASTGKTRTLIDIRYRF